MIYDRLDRLETAVQHGTQIMESKGYMDEEYIGKFWGVVETRPYMRLRSAFMETLLAAGMMRRAAEECEEMLRLCEGDNLGIRYVLMHVYAFLEDEEKALKLHEKYDDFEETQMLLPLSVLYYKLRCMDRAKEYLDRVVKANPDTKRFFRALRQDRLEELEAEISDFGYRPFTFEELVVEYRENEFLFRTVEAYGRWADRQLIVKKKQ
jgi:tetratricopeptide (TPR) repeat protein